MNSKFLSGIAACALFATSQASASTLDITPTIATTFFDGCTSVQLCSGYKSPFYSAQPGDIVNFGTALSSTFYVGDQYGDVGLAIGDFIVSFTGDFGFTSLSNLIGYAASCNSHNPSCPWSLPSPFDLRRSAAFTIPDGANGIQLAWDSHVLFSFTPIPSALPLFATGLGLLYWLRRRA